MHTHTLKMSQQEGIATCTSNYVLIYEREEVNIVKRMNDSRCSFDGITNKQLASQATTTTCCSLQEGVPVHMPQRPATGIVNTAVRDKALQEYAQNPLVFTVRLDCDEEQGNEEEEEGDNSSPSSSLSRHFMGFGFSKEMPYFPPGTIIRFVERRRGGVDKEKKQVRITGMVAAYGHRSQEFAVMLSLDSPVHVDAVSHLLETYNMTEIDGGDEGFSSCLATIIRKYTHAVGDLDPCCVSTDTMENTVATNFQGELERMFECVQATIAHACSQQQDEQEQQRISECIEKSFELYRQTLLLQMRHQPLGTREWIQMFESYMTFAAAEKGLGFLDFVLY